MGAPSVVCPEPAIVSPALYLSKCVLRSSVMLQAVYGHFRSPSTYDLVFGKETVVELAAVSEDGVVQSVCEQPVFGSINDLRVLPWNEIFCGSKPELYGKDLLVLLSDSGKLSFLTFSNDLQRFLAVEHVHLGPSGHSIKDLGRLLAVEPRGRALAVAAFADKIAVFPRSTVAGNSMVEKRIIFPEKSRSATMEASTSGLRETTDGCGTIWSMSFVESTQEFMQTGELALILVVLCHRPGPKASDILVLKCDTKERVIYTLAAYDPSAEIAGHLALSFIEFPVLPGYLLLSRLGDLLLLDLRSPCEPHVSTVIFGQQQCFGEKARTLEDGEGPDTLAASALLELFSRGGDSVERSSICAWSWQPDGGDHPKLVLGMDTGDIAIADVSVENTSVIQIEIRECMYRYSPCRALLWMNGGYIAALSEMGDGQVLEVVDGAMAFHGLLQNISPIVDFSLVDYHDDKQDQMFACCGVGREGSIRVIGSGISVERLLSTPPVYQGVTGIWTLHLFHDEEYHSFFVMSFVEETRVLSVGLNFVDISESVGFESSASTLTCGLIEDGWMVQVCSKEVHLCSPSKRAHPAGYFTSSPAHVSWKPRDAYISLGAVSKGTVILAMSRPGLLMILGTSRTKVNAYELVEIQQCQLAAEVSCISIPCEEELQVGEDIREILEPCGFEIGKVCVVGTHKPSVELLSIEHGKYFKPLACGVVSLVNSIGTVMGGCVPENVRLALFDRLYVLCGLRNGMLLRYEWPLLKSRLSVYSPKTSTLMDMSSPALYHDSSSNGLDADNQQQSKYTAHSEKTRGGGVEPSSPVYLHLVDVRRIGISPVSFIPLRTSLKADIIALSDRPWLLQTSRNSQKITYRSLALQPSTYGAPVRSSECPNGVIFVADCSLHLVEMEHSKRLNVTQRLPLSRTPRRVLYHSATKMLLVMRSDALVSDICCVDPLTGTIQNCFQLDEGEIGRCMQLWQQGSEQFVLVGTGLTDGKPIMPNGEPESSKGRLLTFRIQSKFAAGKSKRASSSCRRFSSGGTVPLNGDREGSLSNTCRPMVIDESTTTDGGSTDEPRLADNDGWELSMMSQTGLPGMILAVSPYLEQYVLASAGNNLFCLGFSHDSPQRLRRFSSTKTRFVITSIATHLNRIAVGDCRDGVLFYSYREDIRKFEQLHCDPGQRLVADCVLVDLHNAVVTDRFGNFCVLSSPSVADESISPERNLVTSCWYHLGETIMRIKKGSFAYRADMEESLKVSSIGTLPQDLLDESLMASTLLGSVVIFIRLTSVEYNLLEALQVRLASHPLAAPLLGNNHSDYRRQGCPAGVCQVLDGDMLDQFLEMTAEQQQMVLAGDRSDDPLEPELDRRALPLRQVLRLFEKVHDYIT